MVDGIKLDITAPSVRPAFGERPVEPAGQAGTVVWLGWLIIVLGMVLAARVLALIYNQSDLFFDEAQYWSWSVSPAFGYYSKPPLIAWVIGFSTSICGTSEFCIRLPSPILHTATALTVFAVAARLYGGKTGFWSAVVLATLPGVSFSAGLISTDVPLLLFWGLALLGLVGLIENRQSWWAALLLGLALGLGLNAKYAMAYFVLCTVIYAAATPEHRWLLRCRGWWVALVIGALLIVPNMIWNYLHSFATFSHTADNAKWGGPLFHPNKALEFFASQFGVFGPILFGALLVIAVRAYRQGLPPADRFLLAFVLPMIIIVTVQAFLSRAHANWAAVSYVAATILVTATMVRELSWRWLRLTLALHVALIVGIGLVMSQARTLALPGAAGKNPFSRTLGWKQLADVTRQRLGRAGIGGRPVGSVLTGDRSVTAELLYYMRDSRVPILAWPSLGRPKDHYQLTRAFSRSSPEPVLLVTEGPPPKSLLARFARSGAVEKVAIPAGSGAERVMYFVVLDGFRGRRPGGKVGRKPLPGSSTR